jgi:acetyl-CoA decarbonylase/synthase complex subunit delta
MKRLAEKENKEDLLNLIDLLTKFREIELEDVEMEFGDLELWLQSGVAMPAGLQRAARLATPRKAKPTSILPAEFVPPIEEYVGQVVEVKIGATKGEGGTRRKSITLGGESAPAFYLFESTPPNPPVVSLDVFDTHVPLAKPVKTHFKEVLGDPVAWARLAVDKFGADMITLHLISIDPLVNDTSPDEAAKTVENVLEAVDVPIIIGGCGDPKKDLAVFEKVAEVGAGERFLLSSVTQDMDIERACIAARTHGHAVLSFTPMDLNQARQLNRHLYDFLPKNQIVMDTTTAALGYGLDYAFTIMERARLAALMGDPELQHPMSSGTTNAWAAREAWKKMDPEWGPRELRGPIWETVTALTLLLAGVDLFMMMHPAAVRTLKEVINNLMAGKSTTPEQIVDWTTAKI